MKAIATALMLATAPFFSSAAVPSLKVGDPAPKLQPGKWVQGQPVKAFEKGKAYLVEFWATWCGPCKVSIPHLNDLHNKYQAKGLVVIGQNCLEQNESGVEPFIKGMGDKMTYRIALDDKTGNPEGKMAESWMTAAGQNGIPCAFLVDTKGVIAWIGHPMQLQDKVIEAVLAGTFDVKKAAAEEAQARKNQEALRPVMTEFSNFASNKEWDKAEAKLDEAEKLAPDFRDRLGVLRFRIKLSREDYPAAYKLAAQLSDTYKDNGPLQFELSQRILRDPSIKQRDLPFAEKAATRANEATEGKEPAVLAGLARALFMNGKKDKAIECQQKAVNLAEGEMKKDFQGALDSYQKGELPAR